MKNNAVELAEAPSAQPPIALLDPSGSPAAEVSGTDQQNWRIVDIGPNGGGAGRRAAREFGGALETTGFAIITGHGVSEALATDLYGRMTEFFIQPVATKAAYVAPEQSKGRGYLPLGVESVGKTLAGETPPDLCEALVFTDPHRERQRVGRPNIWPDRPEGLSDLVRRWTQAMLDLTRRLAELSAEALDLPSGYFAQAYADPSLVLRFPNYPDQAQPPLPGQLRYGEHQDFSALTIVRQDPAQGGLQVRTQDRTWEEAPVIPGSFIINVGDLMARWTNDRWRSTLHRVSNPDPELAGTTRRLSLVAFTGPNDDYEVACLPSCTDADHPALYEPVRAGPYVRAKIAASMDLAGP